LPRCNRESRCPVGGRGRGRSSHVSRPSPSCRSLRKGADGVFSGHRMPILGGAEKSIDSYQLWRSIIGIGEGGVERLSRARQIVLFPGRKRRGKKFLSSRIGAQVGVLSFGRRAQNRIVGILNPVWRWDYWDCWDSRPHQQQPLCFCWSRNCRNLQSVAASVTSRRGRYMRPGAELFVAFIGRACILSSWESVVGPTRNTNSGVHISNAVGNVTE